MLFLRISIFKETEMELSREFVKTQWNKGENEKKKKIILTPLFCV